MLEELVTAARMADLKRGLRTLDRDGGPEKAASPGAWRSLRISPPVVESPRADARRILNRWLAACKAGARMTQTA